MEWVNCLNVDCSNVDCSNFNFLNDNFSYVNCLNFDCSNADCSNVDCSKVKYKNWPIVPPREQFSFYIKPKPIWYFNNRTIPQMLVDLASKRISICLHDNGFIKIKSCLKFLKLFSRWKKIHSDNCAALASINHHLILSLSEKSKSIKWNRVWLAQMHTRGVYKTGLPLVGSTFKNIGNTNEMNTNGFLNPFWNVLQHTDPPKFFLRKALLDFNPCASRNVDLAKKVSPLYLLKCNFCIKTKVLISTFSFQKCKFVPFQIFHLNMVSNSFKSFLQNCF